MPGGKRLCLNEPLTAKAVVLLIFISAPDALLFKLKRDKAVFTENSFCTRMVVSSAKQTTRSSADEPGIGVSRKRRDWLILTIRGYIAMLNILGERPHATSDFKDSGEKTID
jgi:hypothetical protein